MKDMTKGDTKKLLIIFAIPMIIGNIFQQMYNTTDAIIVGKYIGKSALAAVGVSNPIVALTTFFMMGLCIGMSILVSQFVGAKKYDELKREISTSLIMGSIFTGVISVLCILLSKNFLILMGTPIDILKDANIFLKITFGGLIFTFLYNLYSSSLRSLGDSKTPLIFLILSTILNGIFCILLVAFFKMGIAGSAIATVVSQGIAAISCIIYVHLRIPEIRLGRKDLVVDMELLKQTIQYSWLSALQQASLYIGRLLVQGIINPFGTNTIAAYNTVNRVDGFFLAPGDSFAAAVSTYSAQNKGAGEYQRIKEGYYKANMLIVGFNLLVTFIVFFQAENIMRFFIQGSEREVIKIGVDYLHRMSMFYILGGLGVPLQGLFRGVGNLKVTLISTVLSIVTRITLSYTLTPFLGVTSVIYGTVIGWLFLVTFGTIMRIKYFKEIDFKKINIYEEI